MAGIGAGVGQILSTPLRPGVAGYHPSKDNDFGRTAKHRLENIETQEEKESGSVKLKLESHLVVGFGLKKEYRR